MAPEESEDGHGPAEDRVPNIAAVPASPVLKPWVPDADANVCKKCRTEFGWFTRKVCSLQHIFVELLSKSWASLQHHCRFCGDIFCGTCTPNNCEFGGVLLRACDQCHAKRR